VECRSPDTTDDSSPAVVAEGVAPRSEAAGEAVVHILGEQSRPRSGCHSRR
jgi:hypothetical protein